MIKIKRLLAFMLVIVTSFCFVGCGMSDEEIEQKAEEMLAIDKAVIARDTIYSNGDEVDSNILELQMKDETVYKFVPLDEVQDSSDSFNVREYGSYSFFSTPHILRIERDDSLEGKDVYLDLDKEENKYKFVVGYGAAINEYSVLYVSPDLYEILVDKLCNTRECDVIYDSNDANLQTMSDEQKEFMKDFSEDIKVKED